MMKKELKKEIDELLNALRLQPRDAWADEADIPVVAGRCSGSYGCGVGTGIVKKSSTPISSKEDIHVFFLDLATLLGAGIKIENAVAALGRKYQSSNEVQTAILSMIVTLRNPDATKADFSKAISGALAHSKNNSESIKILKAFDEGVLDAIGLK